MEFEEITREEWGAQEAKTRVELWSPVSKILYLYGTESEPCSTKEECIKVVRGLQIRDLYRRRMPDVNYNFMIGGDGNVYEGRGFSKKVTLRTDFVSNALVIGFIGDWAVEDPPQIMFDVADEFIKRYIVEGKIAPNWTKGYIR